MVKPTKRSFNKKVHLKITVLVVTAIALIVSTAVYFLYKHSADDPTVLREALIRSSASTHSPAPIEPKTGDTYFPEMNLYVPRGDQSIADYTYHYYSAYDGTPALLSVTTHTLAEQAATELYGVTNSRELFDKLPYMQACQRGLTLTTQTLPSMSDEKLHHDQQLQDGRTLYVYTDTGCAALSDVADTIKSISSY